MAWSNEKAFGGAATGAGIGSAFGPVGTGIGAVAGGILGGIFGGNTESKANQYTAKVEGLLKETPYTAFLNTPEGQEIHSTLQNEINRQYNTTLREGKITAGRNAEAREMLSSNVLPREQDILRKDLQNVRAGEQNVLGTTLANAEVSRRASYEATELEKKIRLANLWDKAGTASTAEGTNTMNTLVNVAKGFGIDELIKKYSSPAGAYATGG